MSSGLLGVKEVVPAGRSNTRKVCGCPPSSPDRQVRLALTAVTELTLTRVGSDGGPAGFQNIFFYIK